MPSTDLDRLWSWYGQQAGRAWVLREWDCFSLLLSGQAALGWGRAFEPVYARSDAPGAIAQLTFARQLKHGLPAFRKIDRAQPGCAVLFKSGRVPVHVGIGLTPGLMAHVDQSRPTGLAEYGPRTDYHHLLDGFYVPKTAHCSHQG